MTRGNDVMSVDLLGRRTTYIITFFSLHSLCVSFWQKRVEPVPHLQILEKHSEECDNWIMNININYYIRPKVFKEQMHKRLLRI